MNKKDFWIKAALWSCGFGAFSDGVVVPLTNLIFAEYPDSSLFVQNMILSGSSLFALASALLCGWLIKRMDLRTILIAGSICFLIGGVGGAFAPDLGFLMATRILDGLSDGILGVAAISAITRLYKDEGEKSEVLGGYNTVSALFGLIVSTLAGIIALRSWRAAFFCNAVSGIGTLLVILFVPSMPPVGGKETRIAEGDRKTAVNLWLAMLYYLISASLITQTYYLSDFYVAEKNIGNSVQSGTLLSVLTICNMLSGVAFPWMYKKFKKQFKALIFFLTAASLLILFFAGSYLPAAVGFGLAGFINGIGAIYFSMYVSEESPEDQIGMYAALYNITMYVQGFLCPYVPSLFFGLISTEAISDTYVCSAVVCLFFAVFFVAQGIRANRKQKEEL